jgi:hypothetical protein
LKLHNSTCSLSRQVGGVEKHHFGWLGEPAGWPALLEDGKQQHRHNQLLLRAWQE